MKTFSSRQFSWDRKNNRGCIEASEFYPIAYSNWFLVKSERTGKIVEFEFIRTHDGEDIATYMCVETGTIIDILND